MVETSEKQVLMKCGHVANATTENHKPCCVICSCTEVVNETPNLQGRKAVCTFCKCEENSSLDLPFFEYKPSEKEDEYYCGCLGWD
jgi:hypothetical protein